MVGLWYRNFVAKKDDFMGMMVLGLVLFIAMHLVRIVAPGIRDAGLAKLGDSGWKILYTVVSVAGVYLIGRGYGAYRAEGSPILYEAPVWMSHMTLLLMAISFIFIVAGNLPSTGYIKAKLKLPMLMGIKVWAIAHLLANGDVGSVVLFGAMLIWAIISVIGIKKRGLEPPVASSVKPDIIAVVLGLVLWFGFAIWVHTWLIGVAVIA